MLSPAWGRHLGRRCQCGQSRVRTPGSESTSTTWRQRRVSARVLRFSPRDGSYRVEQRGGDGEGSAQLAWLRRHYASGTRCTSRTGTGRCSVPGPTATIRTRGPCSWRSMRPAPSSYSRTRSSYERSPGRPGRTRRPARGIRQFVVGTGGAHSRLHSARASHAGPRQRLGRLKVTLGGEGTNGFMPSRRRIPRRRLGAVPLDNHSQVKGQKAKGKFWTDLTLTLTFDLRVSG